MIIYVVAQMVLTVSNDTTDGGERPNERVIIVGIGWVLLGPTGKCY